MKKHNLSRLAIITGTLLASSTTLANPSTTEQISKFGVHYTVVSNKAAAQGVDCAKLGADWALCNQGVITLTNPGAALMDKDWAIYFHSIRQILHVDNDQFKVTHITGDLHKLEPTDKFSGFPAKGRARSRTLFEQ